MDSPYRLERVSPDNLADLLPIFQSAFGAQPALEKLWQKFDTTAFGRYTVGFIAYHTDSGGPAAYYGVFPTVVQVQGKAMLAAQSGDTMTHKEHQGKGLFTQLARQTYQAAKEEGIAFVFGFPNKNSSPGFFKKLDWQLLHRFELYKIRIPTLPLAALAHKYPALTGAYGAMLPATKPSAPNSVLQKRLNAAGHDGLPHDTNFWAYKNRVAKLFSIQHGALSISAKVDKNLYLGDIYNPENVPAKAILSLITRFAALHGCNVVFASASPGTPLAELFKSKFTPAEGLEVGYIPLAASELDYSRLAFTYADCDTF